MRTKIQRKSQLRVKKLLDQTQSLISEDTSKTRIHQIDKQLLEEQIRQTNFLKVATEINKLNDQKPEYIRQFYDQAKDQEYS